jgi:predicted ATPase/DNA-binding SARP family transcriptional activator
MTHLQISLLGSIQIVAGGEPLTAITSPKILALLAYLSAESARAHSRETLAELLWSGQVTGRQNLRQSLSRLHNALSHLDREAPFLLSSRQEIGFNLASNATVDLAQFTAQVSSIRRHLHPTLHQCRSCCEELSAVVRLYRGDFLDGLLVESPPFEEWALLKREWLRQEVLWALDALTLHAAEQKEYGQASRYARRQIEIDPLREEAYRQVMLALTHDGQRTAALAQYQILAEHLHEDLGLTPSAETTALYEQIRTVARTADRSGPMSPPHRRSQRSDVTPSPLHNLPPQFTPFVGREQDRHQIHERLDRDECRLLTLVGPGGMGKTRLAIQVAYERLAHYEDGVWFISLAELASAAQVIDAIAGAVDVRFGSKAVTTDRRRAELLRDLRPCRMLLVLDNLEHLLSGELSEEGADVIDLVLDLIRQAPQIDLLVTSRQPFTLRAEWLFDVQGLPYPDQSTAVVDPALLAQYDAVQFWVQACRRLHPQFTLDTSTTAAAQQICALVGGAPLALELAAATIRTRSPEQIAEGIRHSLDSLATAMRDMPQRHRTLRAVFDDSWQLLSPAAQMHFRRISVFHGSFSAAAAAEITGVPADELLALWRYSLLQRETVDDKGERFMLHMTLRQFAAEHLAADPSDAHKMHTRHCHHYTTVLAQQQAHLESGDSIQAAAVTQQEMENIRAAWSWAVTHVDVDALARGTHSLLRHYVLTNLVEEGERAFGQAAAVVQAQLDAQTNPHPVRVAILADLTAAHARMLFKLARYKDAVVVAGRAAAMAEGVGAQRPAAMAHLYGGIALLYQAHNTDAKASFESALALARAADWPKIESDALRGLGILYDQQEDPARAEHYYTVSLEISRQIRDLRGASASLGNLGVIQHSRGNHTLARTALEEALTIHEEIGDSSSTGRTLTHLGNLARDQGDLSAAETYLIRACQVLRDVRDRHHEADALLELARLYQHLDQRNEATRCLERALLLYGEVEDQAGAAEVSALLGEVEDE